MFLLAGAALWALRRRYGSQLVGIGRRHLTAALRGAQYLPLRGYRFILRNLIHRTPELPPPSPEDGTDPSSSNTPLPPQSNTEPLFPAQDNLLETGAAPLSLTQADSFEAAFEAAEPEDHEVALRSEAPTDQSSFLGPAMLLTSEPPQTQFTRPGRMSSQIHGPPTTVATRVRPELWMTFLCILVGFLIYLARRRVRSVTADHPIEPPSVDPPEEPPLPAEIPRANFWDAPGTFTNFDRVYGFALHEATSSTPGEHPVPVEHANDVTQEVPDTPAPPLEIPAQLPVHNEAANGDAAQTMPDAPGDDVSPGPTAVPQVAPAASMVPTDLSTVTMEPIPRYLRVTAAPPLVSPDVIDMMTRLAQVDRSAYETVLDFARWTLALTAPVAPGGLLGTPPSTQNVAATVAATGGNQPPAGDAIHSGADLSSTAPVAESASPSVEVQDDSVVADAVAPVSAPLNSVILEPARAAQYNRWVDSDGRPIAGPSRLG
ncbi:uncharacterized protein C8Q71DRAFT_855876 [Rhodofomes roseus]|uniref:Uncharacterized protein n=1 Tax=Rhodofomes roseus TaxID=34475 RepID=A0ABQ8KMF0_9APHY|nr:uncharacterized protein C8Q71DRAFT_855876 [Rhodofomes roseus]KAH9839245.1 hypothetical protein C8Q71DRAFT_855876 [Rhodofomes roseus]